MLERRLGCIFGCFSLNESPSEKEGKCLVGRGERLVQQIPQ